mgnify:CR=1 FL=1
MQAVALYFGTFLHEDVAILAGSFLVVEMEFPRSLALTSLYLGIVSGDLALYGLGRIARRSAFLQRILIGRHVERLRAWLDQNLVLTIIACRLLPGTVFPVFVACGWFGLSLRRFLATTLISSFIYAAVLLSAVTALGEAVITHLGDVSWAIIAGGLVIVALFGILHPYWNMLPRILGVLGRETHPATRTRTTKLLACRGMPPIEQLQKSASLAERIPPILFYMPIVAQWIYLGCRNGSLTLPTIADPLLQAGGLLGESKSDCLRQVEPAVRKWFAPFTTVTRLNGDDRAEATIDRALTGMGEAGLDFPIVVKPDIGWRGFGVQLIQDRDALGSYLKAFPEDETVILQKNVDYDGEVCFFYVRMPDTEKGWVFSLTFRYFPHVIGDGQSAVRQLIWHDARGNWKSHSHQGIDPLHCGLSPAQLDAVPADGQIVRLSFIGSNRVGGLYRDAQEYITPALTDRIDEIAKAIPEFYFGRFDARFKSMDALMRGEDFQIIEINGAGGEAINIWDPDMPLYQVYLTLFQQQSMMFEIARKNRQRGYKPIGLLELYSFQKHQQRLIPLYPPSN